MALYSRVCDPANHRYLYVAAEHYTTVGGALVWRAVVLDLSSFRYVSSDPTQGVLFFAPFTPNSAYPNPALWIGYRYSACRAQAHVSLPAAQLGSTAPPPSSTPPGTVLPPPTPSSALPDGVETVVGDPDVLL